MKTTLLIAFTFAISVLLPTTASAQTTHNATPLAARPAKPRLKVCSACIRAHEEFLASDAMQGRSSGTHDELIAATYIAAQLRAYGIAPAGDDGGYVQSVPLFKSKATAPPTIEIVPADGGAKITLAYGKDFLIRYLSRSDFSGPLQKFDADHVSPTNLKAPAGAIALVTGDAKKVGGIAHAALNGGAIAALIAGNKSPAELAARTKDLPTLPNQLQSESGGEDNSNFLELSPDATKTLAQLPDGTQIHFHAPADQEKGFTWNALGILPGSDPKLRHKAVLLSAHLDHLGVGRPVNGDSIYNGADDDASGTTAVLELARVLGAGPRPRRTVIFALFGSEEAGGLGSTYFREHPPIPLKEFAANLEFEMIGRADPKVKADTVWLTGWERSNLGPTLAAHGANLVGDPHPEQNFFARSDNYVLAKKGVVAQTVSSYGLHQDYHRPSDDLAHLDFKHMDAAVASMLAPVEWLVNSDFTPTWNKGGQP
jgi:aminopeptidase YwaD